MSNRGSSAYQPNVLPLGQTGSPHSRHTRGHGPVMLPATALCTLLCTHGSLHPCKTGSAIISYATKVVRPISVQLSAHHQNDSYIKMGSDESHLYVSLAARDKVTRQCPQTTTFEEKGEPKQIRTEVLLLTSLTPYR